MREPRIQTRRLTMTHGLTHAAKRRCRNGLMRVRESVSLNLHPLRREKKNYVCVYEGACVPASACACGRACARVCVRGLKQTHRTHRLTPAVAISPAALAPYPPVRTRLAHVASFAPGWPTTPSAPGNAHVATGAGVPKWQSVRECLRPGEARPIGTSKNPVAADARGNSRQFHLTFFRQKNFQETTHED